MQMTQGEIIWTVENVNIDGQNVTELRFEKQRSGEFAGQFHPLFFQLPMVFLSNFIDPEYKLWQAFLGDYRIGSNLVYDNGRLLSWDDAQKAIEDFANAD